MTRYYKRAGGSYYYDANWNFYQVQQKGHVTLVETADGSVYVKDIIAYYNQGSWVRGTIEGNTLTIPVGQPLAFNTQYDMTLSLHWGVYNDNGWSKSDIQQLTFTVDGDQLSLQGSDENNYIGAFWDGGNYNFSGWGDYQTVWTLDTSYVPASQDLVELPDGLSVSSWYAEGEVYQGQKFERTVGIAVSGNDIYVRGIFEQFPNSWIKGTFDGSSATFACNQYLGASSDGMPVWAAAYSTAGPADMVFTFDPEDRSFNSTGVLLANASDDAIMYYEAYSDFSFMPTKPGETIVDELPYSNDFETKSRRRQFTVIDANGDQSTWTSGLFTHPNTYVFYYTYNSGNGGDDWLVSPAIKLEAGKNYRFALNAWAERSSFPERVEVKLGKAATAEAMTQQIVEPTVVNNTVFENVADESVLLENNSFTVDETGYYFVGIHAISDRDMYYLYVDNFVLDLGVSDASPAAVTDLVIAQTPGVLETKATFVTPTQALNGEPLTEPLTKVMLYRDGQVVASVADVAPGSHQTLVDNTGLTIGVHAYQVVASTAGGQGEMPEPTTVFVALPLDVPAVYDFTVNAVLDQVYIINANNDDHTWAWSGSSGFEYNFTHNNADEYLITQPVHLQAGVGYNVLANVSAKGEDERFEIKLGKSPTIDGLNLTVMEPTIVSTNEQFVDFDNDFTVAESGDYFVSFHCISDADHYRLMVRKIIITQTATMSSPSAPQLTVVPDSLGRTVAMLAAVAPTTSIDGEQLTQNLSKLEFYRDDHLFDTAIDVAPGATVTIVDSTATLGTHTYHAVPYNAAGEPGEASGKVTIYVGQDLPKAIHDVRYSDNGDGYTLMWDKVDTIGRNQGYVNPALVDYVISDNQVSEIAGVVYDAVGQEIGRVRDCDHFTLTGLNTDEGEQRVVPYYVRTENITGATTDYQKYLIIGAPYELPFTENFADRTLHSVWDYGDGTAMGVSTSASDDDGVALRLGPSGTYGLAWAETGKLALNKSVNPVLTFDMRRGETSEKELMVYAVLPDGSHVTLQTVPINADYTTFEVALANEVLQTARFARIGFSVDFAFPSLGHYVLIDNIQIVDQHILGDVTGDGKVDISDVNAVINMMLGKADPTAAGEATGDGKIDIADVNAVINIMLGKTQ